MKNNITKYFYDLPNVCTLSGLIISMIGIYMVLIGNTNAAVVCITWALLFDWTDGKLARKSTNRPLGFSDFGRELDSLCDVITYGILPGLVAWEMTGYSIYFLPAVTLLQIAVVVRLSFFNIHGLDSEHCYYGLSADFNGILFSFFYLTNYFFPMDIVKILLIAVTLVVAILNLSSIRIKKYGDSFYYFLIAYAVIHSLIFIVWSK